jgi:hypothetical protein
MLTKHLSNGESPQGVVLIDPSTNLPYSASGGSGGSTVLGAGTALIGKVGIDQTTPGVTDSVSVKASAKTVYILLNAVLTNQTSAGQGVPAGRKWFQTSITGTGAVSATVTFYGNTVNSTTNMVALTNPILLSGTTTDQGAIDLPCEPPYIFAKVESISGTNAAVTASVSV